MQKQWDALKVTSIKLHQILMTSEPPPGRQTSPFSKGEVFKKPHALWCNIWLLFCFHRVPSVNSAPPPRLSCTVALVQRELFSRSIPEFLMKKGHRQVDCDLLPLYFLWFVLTYWSSSINKGSIKVTAVCAISAPPSYILTMQLVWRHFARQ